MQQERPYRIQEAWLGLWQLLQCNFVSYDQMANHNDQRLLSCVWRSPQSLPSSCEDCTQRDRQVEFAVFARVDLELLARSALSWYRSHAKITSNLRCLLKVSNRLDVKARPAVKLAAPQF